MIRTSKFIFPTSVLVGVFATQWLFSTKNKNNRISQSNGSPKIGDTVKRVFDGKEDSYTVFGATGHSLKTCKIIEANCRQKTHQIDYLFFVTTNEAIPLACAYAKTNAGTDNDNTPPAVAYLGINQLSVKTNSGSLGRSVLNSKDPDIQVVHIETKNL